MLSRIYWPWEPVTSYKESCEVCTWLTLIYIIGFRYWPQKSITWIIVNRVFRVPMCSICLRVLNSLSGGPPSCYSLDLFSVTPISTPWLHFVNSQLVCLLPVGIFKCFMLPRIICFFLFLNVKCLGACNKHYMNS